MMRPCVISGPAGWQCVGRAALLGAILCVCMGGCNKAAPGPSVTVGAVATSVPATVAASATPTATATITPGVIATATVMPTVTPTSSPTATSEPVPVDVADWQTPLFMAAWTTATANEIERLAVESPQGARQAAFALGIVLGKFLEGLEEWEPGLDQAIYKGRLLENVNGVGMVIGAWVNGGPAEDVPAGLAPWRAECDQVLSELVDDVVSRGADRAEMDAWVAEVMGSVVEAMQ